MGPPPVVTGISPKEATAGIKITIRGENFGTSPQDLLGVNIVGADCLLTCEWKSANKIIALCPPREGKGDIIIATVSGGLGTCNVQLKVYKESIGPLKEVAYWTPEKFHTRRKHRTFAPTTGDNDDPLGLSVERSDSKISEAELRELFGDQKSSDIGTENFDPGLFLLEAHQGTTFEDLKAGLAFLKRKVDGENESQLSFIKANVNSIVDQLDTLRRIKKRYEIDCKEYGREPTVRVEEAVAAAKKEADQMFFDVLGRKDRADATRNALNVMNRFKFLFYLPANIEANIAKGDFDRVIDEYERAKSLYGDTDSEIFLKYLHEIDKGVEVLRTQLSKRLREEQLPVEQQKRFIAILVQLRSDGDPAWECLQIQYSRLLKMMDDCRDEHVNKAKHALTNIPKPFLQTGMTSSPSSNRLSALFPNAQDTLFNQGEFIPEPVLFVEDLADRLANDFPDLWKLGQAYFKGDLGVQPDHGKSTVFKEMILGGIRYFCNLIRSAVIPQTFKKGLEASEYWSCIAGEQVSKQVGLWLPHSLRNVRSSYKVFIELDLPGQALDIIKTLTTDLRIQCLQVIFQTVIDQVHLLHEKEEWHQDINDEFGAITELPDMFGAIVTESVQLIKESLLSVDNREDDILSYKNAYQDLELLIQNVLSSFAFTLENAAIEDYRTGASNIPSDSVRLRICINNCQYTLSNILPKIQKAFQDIRELSLEKPISEAFKCYHILDGKLFEAYMELKCEPIVAIIEPSMYTGKFDWARCPKPVDARDYVKEIIHKVIAVHSEVERSSATGNTTVVNRVMFRLVESVCEEVNRLFCCISRMNSNGCIQAWVDINCLRLALKPYLNQASTDYLDEAAKPLLDLERPGDKEVVKTCEDQFKNRMKFHLYTFQGKNVAVN